jgi:hypothetical protein
MKVYIQEIETGRYFKNPYVWVEDKLAAYNFVTSLEAFDFCLQMNHGKGARILLSFDDPQHEICLFSFDGKAEAAYEPMVEEMHIPGREPALAGAA